MEIAGVARVEAGAAPARVPSAAVMTAAADRFRVAIEAATRDNLEPLLACVSAGLRFEDPLNRTEGKARFRALMLDTWKGFPGARFKVRRIAIDGDRLFIRWSLVREQRGVEISLIEAIGQTVIGADGLAVRHVDYWDSVQAIHRRIPVLAFMLERLRRLFSVGWSGAGAVD